MRVRNLQHRFFHIAAFAAITLLAGNSAQANVVDLGATPPDLTASVPPNLVVTFDDSGSMASRFMGDNRPFDNGSWSGPWECAGVIDDTSVSGIGTHVMNGVFYNPSTNYTAPVYADGSNFTDADNSLKNVQDDGITAKRLLNPSAGSNTDFTQKISITASKNRSGKWTYAWNQAPVGCPYDESRKPTGDNTGTITDPLNGVTGPYYYRYTGPTLTLDSFGDPDSTSQGNLYTASNWTVVKVSDNQGYANWWSFYRTRNMMARSSLSRVFANNSNKTSDGGYGSSIRAAWQNLYTTDKFILGTSTIISSLLDTSAGACKPASMTLGSQSLITGSTKVPPSCYRSDFFNWIFQVPASSGTPTRSSTARSGVFFTRGNGNTDTTGDLHDPYWQPLTNTGTGHELYCRQNYHVLITDGLWNGDADGPLTSALTLADSGPTLPDGVKMPAPSTSGTGNVTSIYAPQHDSGDDGYASLSDIAFHYWATDLRSDLYDPANNKTVAPYLPDKTTTVFNLSGTTASSVASTKVNPEIYFNPANDPATWPHMDEFMIGLGVDGNLHFSQDLDCTGGAGDTNDACLLRKGLANSYGSTASPFIGWPPPNGAGSGISENIDDTWHAALAGRGQFFSARNPDDLVNQLSKILNNIQARSSTTAGLAVSVSTASTSTAGFSGGYNSGDWSGNLPKFPIDPATGQPNTTAPQFDAGCILTGTTPTAPCPTTGQTNVTQAVAPTARNVYTYGGTSTPTLVFKTLSSLSNQSQCLLNNGTWVVATSTCTGSDGFGQKRIDYLRGDRTLEAVGSTPQLRQRGSLLGAIVDSEPSYVGSPTGGFRDAWPTGSPEIASGAQTYSNFVDTENGGSSGAARTPMVYAAANDGMLHAFRASDGTEAWAYVPQTVINNGALTKYANNAGFVPTVDGGITVQDVFFTTTKKWRTILVGSLRLGGRAVYALDITNADAAPTVLWEFSNTSTSAADMGFSYATPNISRLAYNDGTNAGKWTVLVSSGYMPVGSLVTDTATTTESLFVLDAQTGAVIRELKTSSKDANAFGLATPALWDYAADQVDDIAAAGDLMGNLWRFDLTSASSASWTFEKLFQTTQPVPLTFPAPQPITVKPVSISDPINSGNPIWIFGTGKYLSNDDNTSLNVPSQWFYGIRDYGTGASTYPILTANLVQQTLSESSKGVRALTQLSAINGAGALAPGWKFQMADAGERAVIGGVPLYNSGRVILTSLIPKGDDPCAPGRGGAVMVVDSSTGGAPNTPPPVGANGYTPPSGSVIVGQTVINPPAAGDLPVLSPLGGGQLFLPGFPQFGISDAFWHRRSWRELLNGM